VVRPSRATTDEALWPGSDRLFADYQCRRSSSWRDAKGEKSKRRKSCTISSKRRLIDAEITRRSIAFMERQVRRRRKPFFRLCDPHAAASCRRCRTRHLPAKTGKRRLGPICSPEMDRNGRARCSMAVDRLGLRDNTPFVIFCKRQTGRNSSSHGTGWAGPMARPVFQPRGKAASRVPFMISVAGQGTGWSREATRSFTRSTCFRHWLVSPAQRYRRIARIDGRRSVKFLSSARPINRHVKEF